MDIRECLGSATQGFRMTFPMDVLARMFGIWYVARECRVCNARLATKLLQTCRVCNTPVMATCGDQLFEVWWTWIDIRSTLLPGCKLWPEPERHSEPMITARWLGRKTCKAQFWQNTFVETGERVDQDITSSLASLSIRVQNTSSRPSNSISLQSWKLTISGPWKTSPLLSTSAIGKRVVFPLPFRRRSPRSTWSPPQASQFFVCPCAFSKTDPCGQKIILP